MKSLIQMSVKRVVTVSMVFLVVILLGVMSFGRLPIDLFPEINMPMAAVMTDYSGAGPQEVESMVTKPLESVLSTVQNLDTISSTSSAGSSMVMVTFDWGTDMNFATLQMREKIDLIRNMLPSGVGNVMVMKMDPSMMPVLVTAITGGRDLQELKNTVEDKIIPRLERQNGVASVSLTGGFDREIKIVADPVKMAAYGLSLSNLSQLLMADNRNISAGNLTDGNREIYVRFVGQYETLDELRNFPITLPTGTVIKLADIATIEDTYADVNQISRVNGQDCIMLSIMKQSDGNTVEVVNNINQELEQIKTDLPGNIDIHSMMSQADYIQWAIDGIKSSALGGILLAILVLFIFLRSFRSTCIIAVAIPIALIGAFGLLFLNDMTLNIMTLGGLALGAGMMVDNSIVVLESIFRKREQGLTGENAAIDGTSEVANAVVASTLTTVAVFLPIVFVQGMASMFFKDLALTVSFGLIASLVVSLTLVPMLSAHLLKDDKVKDQNSLIEKIKNFFVVTLNKINQRYGKILNWSLDHRKTVVLAVAAALIVAVAMMPMIGMEFLPSSDSGQFSINISMDAGTKLEDTEKVLHEVESRTLEIGDEIDTMLSTVGGGGVMAVGSADAATIDVVLVGKQERKRTTEQIVEDLRQRVGNIPGAEITIAAVDMTMVSATGDPISLSIKGTDLDTLSSISEDVVKIMEGVDGTRNVKSSVEDTIPEMQVKVNKERAAQYGLSMYQVATVASSAFVGDVATTFRQNGQEIDVRLILPENYRTTVEDLKNVLLPSPFGIQVPLRDVAEITLGQGPTAINRIDNNRVVTVSSQISGRDLNVVADEVMAQVNNLPLPDGYIIESGGSYEEMMDSFSQLTVALLLAVLLVYMVMASLFESLIHPFVIMFSLPTTFIGVVLILALTGKTLNVSTFIGIIILVGIVVNNAIILVDYINKLRERGFERTEAIQVAGPLRLRPIMMTMLTTVLGMLPMAFSRAAGSELSSPMALALIGGLLCSTIFTLVFVPVMYSIFDDVGIKLKRKFKKKGVAN